MEVKLYKDFDFSVLDNPDFKEDSVREELIVPLIKNLNYRSTGKNKIIRRRQDLFSSFVEKVYGARFDRKTVQFIEESAELEITNKRFLKDDVYLLIEGIKKG